MDNITPQQVLFCKWFTTKGDTFSNKTLSYAKAYDYELPLNDNGDVNTKSTEYNTCAANGSRLYFNDNIKQYINTLLVELLNDTVIDARTSEIAINGKDTDSIQAIKIHNDLKNRITKHIDLTTANRPLASLSDDDLKALAD